MRLPNSLRKMLLMNAVSFIIFNYIGIYVNLYIWEQNQRIDELAWFQFVMFFSWAITYVFAAWLLNRSTVRVSFGLSALAAGTTFILLTYLHLDHRFLWIACIGLPVGIMWGFFGAAQNLSVSLNGKGREFAQFFLYSSGISQTINMTVPLLSALVIKAFGYKGSFGMMLVFVTIMLVVSRWLPNFSLRNIVNSQPKVRNKNLKQWYEHLFTTSAARWMIPSALIAGCALQFQTLFSLLFTFSVTVDQTFVALLNILYTVAALIALVIYRKYAVNDRRWLILGVVLLGLGICSALYPVSILLIISNIFMTVGLLYFSSVWNGHLFRVISTFSPSQQSRLLVWREVLICISRCMTLLFILPIREFSGPMFIILLMITIGSLAIIPWIQKKMEQAEDIEVSQPILELAESH